ncbi:MAG: DNA methyltransferase [Isosphaeraceae bacterium]
MAAESVRVALGPMDRKRILRAYEDLRDSIGKDLKSLYTSRDSRGRACDVLYYFWVMQAPCPACGQPVDLFPSWVIARNAYPDKKRVVQVLCPSCGDIFPGWHRQETAVCPTCRASFDPEKGPAHGAKATCCHCTHPFTILDAVSKSRSRPAFRLYGKLVLGRDDRKEYLPATEEDQESYRECTQRLRYEEAQGQILLPSLALENGYNTRQAMSYAFRTWRDFFNDRQLLALGRLRAAIASLDDAPTRGALLTLFSGVLEFNNLFASYKGEGTGAVRHMFSHHILKPERTPIEANVWGTPKSSGSFQTLFRNRLLRAIQYRGAPTEVNGPKSRPSLICSTPFTGRIEQKWPTAGGFAPRAVYLSCGDSAATELPDRGVDLVVTDPPFFDNVHYSELADFFHAWQQLGTSQEVGPETTTRISLEVQDSDAESFALKLEGVFRECGRILKEDGLLVFTYHHSRNEGWKALAAAITGAGFVVVNSQPVKAELSVATPKSQAKEPIQLDIIIVCRRASAAGRVRPSAEKALESAKAKLRRLRDAGFRLSRNDRKIVLFGQLLTSVRSIADIGLIARLVERELDHVGHEEPLPKSRQLSFLEEL